MTFDFSAFLVSARTLGADHVHFRYDGKLQTKKFPEAIGWKRFEHIVKPLCALAGVTHSIGPGGDGIEPEAHYGTVEALYRKEGRIWKFPLLDGPKGYVTVTLRNSFRNTHRNSSPAWAEFIENLLRKREVVVIPECEDEPFSVEERMRLYSNAEMNFGVSNGPMALCHFSEAPHRTFNMQGGKLDTWHLGKTGFPFGSQFSFKNDRQLMIWEPDRIETLMRHVDDC